MSESELQEAEDFLRSRPTVDVTAVDISPNPAALTDELNWKWTSTWTCLSPMVSGTSSIWWTLSPSGSISISFSLPLFSAILR
ncbi:hypothetical protein GQ600_14369 [Phytophthora cactorum]|nr:hypothetical protein GQ600_14369 [Phytophthora cactorum]